MRQLLVIILLVLAVFFSLFPHRVHEKVIFELTGMPSPPHIFHLIMGLTCFFLATVLAQKDYFDDIYTMGEVAAENFSNIKQAAGAIMDKAGTHVQHFASQASGMKERVMPRASRIANKALHKIPSMNRVVDRIESFVEYQKKVKPSFIFTISSQFVFL